MDIKTFFNRIIVKPNEEVTEFYGVVVSASDVTGTLSGEVVAVADNITDIKVGDILHYNTRVEEILINEERYHIVGYDKAYWSDNKQE